MKLLKKLEELSTKLLIALSMAVTILLMAVALVAMFTNIAKASKSNEDDKRAFYNKHPIYAQIIRNSPTINSKYAMSLSNIIYRKAIKYDISSKLLTAILAQETMYTMVQGSCSRGYIKVDPEYLDASIPSDMKSKLRSYVNQEVTICEDFGIGQINHRNIQKFKIDKDKLLTDLDYSVDISAFMLKKIKGYYKRNDSNWFTRYNAVSPSKRQIYKELVERYL